MHPGSSRGMPQSRRCAGSESRPRGSDPDGEARHRRQAPDVERISASAQLEPRQLYERSGGARDTTLIDGGCNRMREQHFAGARPIAKAGGDIDGIAYEGCFLMPGRTQQAERHFAEVYADANARVDLELVAPAFGDWDELQQHLAPGCQRLSGALAL